MTTLGNITAQSASRPSPLERPTQGSGMSFASLLSTGGRSFGFNELGIFGIAKAVVMPEAQVASGQVGPMSDPPPPQGARADSAPSGPARIPAIQSAARQDGPAALSRPASSVPGTAPVGEGLLGDAAAPDGPSVLPQDAAETEEGVVRHAGLSKDAPTSRGMSAARLTVAVDGDAAHVVVQNALLSQEDRDRLRRQVEDVLRDHRLGLADFTLNGSTQARALATYGRKD